MPLPCDLADKAAIAAYVASAAASLDGIDILVNNASGFGGGDTEDGWSKGLDIDVMATVRASNAAIPHIERSGGGAIVNISSISGLGASARAASYAAVKAAVINYTLSQGLMLAPKKIRVNAIAPGSIEFPGGLWETNKTTNPQLYNAVFKSIPVGPHGQARGGRERGAVSVQRPGVVDHRTNPDGRWRPVARVIGRISVPGMGAHPSDLPDGQITSDLQKSLSALQKSKYFCFSELKSSYINVIPFH